jgi:APA family basic amino acid/polyamine antiporter
MIKLKKELSCLDLFCIASGTMISSGLFILPAIAYTKVGPAVFVAYLIASIMVIPGMLCKAELSTAMPKAGGTYFFIDRSMDAGFGTLAGLSAWFSLSFKSAFALIGIGAFATLLFPGINPVLVKLIALSFCLTFGVVNIFGVKHAGRLQVVLVLALIGLLVLYIGKGIPFMHVSNLHPFMNESATFRDLMATAGLIFISYGGLTKIASISEEAKNPSRDIPLSMISALIVVSILYVMAVLVTVGVLGDSLAPGGVPSLTPISDGAKVSMGPIGLVMLSVAAILAFISTANAGIMAASRAPLAMSRDNLLPELFQSVSSRFQTPHYGIIFTTLFMAAAILFMDLELLVKTASTLKILLFTFSIVSVIVMRESGIQNYRPKFFSPLYPWIHIAGIVCYVFLLFEMGKIPLMITGCFMAGGLLWYWLYGRIYANRISALVHLVKRMTAKEIGSHLLNSELKEILLERDEIVEDRFDILVKNARIVDCDEKLNMEDAFRLLAKELSGKIDLPEKEVYSLLLQRERESSTAVSPGLAIPHIILPGKGQFEILLARFKKGISFGAEMDPVHAVFILSGTRDERNYHLKALMYIAQIVQNPKFQERWLKASGEEPLRDIVLLADRKRA